MREQAAAMRIEPGWKTALPLIAGAIALILVLYWRTGESIVAIWQRSETFAHGFLIVPIALFLVWRRRRELAALTPRTDVLGFVLLAGAGLAWLVAEVGQVQVVQQYAMVAMIPAAVIALAGRRVAWALAFPLAFLLFAVPVGEALIPRMMDFTADFTVAALRLTGIPVYREGTFFTIPSGNWSVVEGCSGLRYLIASVTVGTLFGYLNYRRWWKRVLFAALSIAVPIVANGMRAYMIVMIAHLSDMRLALGIDHYIYGWVFFGVVMLLLFWLGSFWADPPAEESRKVVSQKNLANSSLQKPRARLAGATFALVALAAAWPLYAAYLDRPGKADALRLPIPREAAGWHLQREAFTDWRPRYSGAKASEFVTYTKDAHSVAAYIGYYRDQRQGAELITSTNIMVVQKHPIWENVGEGLRREALGGQTVSLRETRLRAPQQRLLVWDWFRMDGDNFSSPYLGKVYLARDKLLGRGDGAAAIILAAPYEDRDAAAAESMRLFARDMLPSIYAALDAVREEK